MVLYRAAHCGRDVLVSRDDLVSVIWRVVVAAVLVFSSLFTMPREASAQTMTAPTFNSFLSDAVAAKLEQLGYAVSDVRFGATLDAISAYAVSVAQGVAAGASSVPWAAVLARVGGVVGLLAVPTQLGDDSLASWQINQDGTITVTSASGTASPPVGSSSPGISDWSGYTGPTTLAPLVKGGPFYEIYLCSGAPPAQTCNYVDSSSPFALAVLSVAVWNQNAALEGLKVTAYLSARSDADCPVSNNSTNGPEAICPGFNIDQYGSRNNNFGFASQYYASGAPGCGTGFQQGANCGDLPVGAGSGSSGSQVWTGTADVNTAIDNLPGSDLSRPLNPQVVADLANGLWEQAAAQPNYQGYPFPGTAPVTAADVSAVSAGLGSSAIPDVSDLVTPLPVPTAGAGSGSWALPVPTTGAGVGEGSNPASSPADSSSPSGDTSELCNEFPAIIACQLPGSASAPDMPSSSASVSVTPVTVGASDGVCPSPVSVSVLGMDLSFSYQSECDFMVRVRPFILAMCGIAAAMVFGMGLKS